MQRIVLGAPALIALGLISTLACGGPGGGASEAHSTPGTVFEGGGGQLQVQFTASQPAVLKTSFAQYDESTDEERTLDASEEFAAGSYTRTIDVSPSTYVYLELGVPEATPGAELSWTISIDGRSVFQESDRLEEALRPGYAFFLQAEADDLAQMRSWGR